MDTEMEGVTVTHTSSNPTPNPNSTQNPIPNTTPNATTNTPPIELKSPKKEGDETKKPTRISDIWEHFTKVKGGDPNNPRCNCNYCGADYACHSTRAGTSSLWVHYRKCKKRVDKKQKVLGFKKETGGGSNLLAVTFNKDNIIELAANIVGCLQNAVIGNEDSYSVIKEYSREGDSDKLSRECTAVVCGDLNLESSNRIAAESASTKDKCSSKTTSSQHEPCSGKDVLFGKHNTAPNTPRTTSVSVKGEPIENNELDKMMLEYSLMKNLVAVKSEPITSDAYSEDDLDHMLLSARIKLLTSRQIAKADIYSEDSRKIVNSSNNELDKMILEYSLMKNLVAVKSEPITSDAYSEDDLDHMLLSARIKLLTSRQIAKADIYSEDSRKIVISSPDCQPILSKSDPPARTKRLRKRKKTATDSVEIALEEDAPGLLQVLVDKGVLIDEMKLYGQTEIDEAIDESFSEFSELEAVIAKLFSQRHSLLKLATLKGTKGEKTSYCLACLISLVEQARYLQFRKWPVEWGWCRDLQSFIFVFERHNRIVLERPEYGYATYFFELVDSLSIDWQVQRLVTTMKLTSCSRITLIENKALTVGEDLTEGEAGVLSDYGWIPDTGLGTMLNYRDRVVHDRKNEADSSEWRSKIGNLLMDGYNGGTVISTSVPKKFADKSVIHNPPIKLEI